MLRRMFLNPTNCLEFDDRLRLILKSNSFFWEKCKKIRVFQKSTELEISKKSLKMRKTRKSKATRLNRNQTYLQTPLLSVSLIWLVKWSRSAAFIVLYHRITSAVLISSAFIFNLKLKDKGYDILIIRWIRSEKWF